VDDEPQPEPEAAEDDTEPPALPDPDWLVELRTNGSPAAVVAGLEDVHRRLRALGG
jgi:hypothetical protein